MKHTIQELHEKQGLPLSMKIKMTESRIREWVNTYGEDGVYVSFSGGKDSTVLLDIARKMYPSIPAAFVNTGLEYPEIVKFVKTFDNVEILKPKKNFKQIISEYGYPFFSKEVSEVVYGARRYLDKLRERERVQTSRLNIPKNFHITIGMKELLEQGLMLEELIDNHRVQKMLGILRKNGKATLETIPSKQDRSSYNMVKYQFLLDAPFPIANKCCYFMKKSPAHTYHRKEGRNPITAQTASESMIRTQKWLQNGCNGFDLKIPTSNPMSFWTEQDILTYVYVNKIPICPVYGDIVTDREVPENIMDLGLLDNRPVFSTTGLNRTGCMFCGFGCHLEKKGEGRFLKLKETHPKIYDYIMKPESEGGLGYKWKIDWINEHGFHIEY